jgi:hypothetical protein
VKIEKNAMLGRWFLYTGMGLLISISESSDKNSYLCKMKK